MPRKFLTSKKHFKSARRQLQPLLLSVKNIYYLKLQLDKQQLSLPPHWVSILTSRHQLKVCKIDENDDISYCLTVARNDLAYSISLYHQQINLETSINTIVDIESLFTVINNIENLRICAGNPDVDFIELATEKNGKFVNMQGKFTLTL